ncbi:AsmA family protein [Aestuariispira ectoiniformans]|uniref:AsmA family protein n=1 Tax=Aestuariispira ectoiniformans TaxID=2775080 RepID=UPI00223AD700|nr:AsmA family protein [Aestuariispira ectoiniformans]
MQKLVLASIGLLIAVVGAVFLLPVLFDWNSLKPTLQQALEERTNCPVSIYGDVSLNWLPSPTLKVGAFSLGETSAKPLFSAKGLEAKVPLSAAFTGDLVAEKVRLVEPAIILSPDRLCNPTEHTVTTPGEIADGKSGSETKIALDNVEIVNGQLSWTYAPDTTPLEISGFNGTVALNKIVSRLDLTGEGNFRGQTSEVKTSLYLPTGDVPYRMSGTFSWPERNQSLQFKARSAGLPPKNEITGSVELNLAGDSLNIDSGKLPAVLAGQELKVASDYVLADQRLTLNNIDAHWGPIHMSGATTARLGLNPNIDTVLTVRPLDLDRLLTGQDAAVTKTGDASPSDKNTKTKRPALGLASLMQATDILGVLSQPGYSLGLEVSVDAVRIGGAVMKDTGFHIAVGDGTVTLDHSRIQLPGGSDLSVLGFLSSQNGQPHFEGGVSFQSDNLRRFLRWAGMPATGIPADRLRSIQIAANLAVEPGKISFPGFSARLDTSNVTGNAQLTSQPSFSMSLATDVLNLDAYALDERLPELLALLASQDVKAGGLVSPAAASSSAPSPALLDWDIAFSAKHLTFAGRPSRDVSVKLRRSSNFLAVENFTVGDFYGMQINGQASVQQDQVASQVNFLMPSPYRTVTRLGAPASVRNRLRNVGNAVGQIVLAGPLGAMQTDIRFNAKDHSLSVRGKTALRAEGLELQLQDSNLSLPGLELRDVNGTTGLNLNGDLTWTGFKAKWLEAPLTATGKALASPGGYNLDTDFQIGLRPLTNRFMSIGRYLVVDGAPVLTGHLTARSGFLDNPAIAIKGQGQLSGMVTIRPLEEMSANNRIRQAKNLAHFIQQHYAKSQAPLTGDLSIDGGRIDFREIRATAPDAAATFGGWVDLANNRISTELNLFETGRQDMPHFRLQAHGDLQYPAIKASGQWISGSP